MCGCWTNGLYHPSHSYARHSLRRTGIVCQNVEKIASLGAGPAAPDAQTSDTSISDISAPDNPLPIYRQDSRGAAGSPRLCPKCQIQDRLIILPPKCTSRSRGDKGGHTAPSGARHRSGQTRKASSVLLGEPTACLPWPSARRAPARRWAIPRLRPCR